MEPCGKPVCALNSLFPGLNLARIILLMSLLFSLPSNANSHVRNPIAFFELNSTVAIGSIAMGALALPFRTGFRIFPGLAVGPVFTFTTSRYTKNGVDATASGLGVQALYSFGEDAIQKGFFIKVFYERYQTFADKNFNIDEGGELDGIFIPVSAAVPIHSAGVGFGYQWFFNQGLRISAGISLVHVQTRFEDLRVAGIERKYYEELIQQPLPIQDNNWFIPLPEISIGWAF